MSDWFYVAVAYGAVGGSLAVYVLLLARRVSQATQVAQELKTALAQQVPVDQDHVSCDTPRVG